MKTKQKYQVLSPDGITIDYFTESYPTMAKAKKALEEWMNRYVKQGYYSSNYGRIPLHELPNACKIIDL